MKFYPILILIDAIDNKQQYRGKKNRKNPTAMSKKTAEYYRKPRENPIDKLKVPIF